MALSSCRVAKKISCNFHYLETIVTQEVQNFLNETHNTMPALGF